MTLLLHPETEKGLAGCVRSEAHAFMLVGPAGSGKLTLARHLAQELLGASSLHNHPGIKSITPEKGSIGIETVRSIQQFMRLKTTGHQAVRRTLIVEDAHLMTVEAQNAFLKILEEPPADTRIILTVVAGQHMLPTIHSRVQMVDIQPPTKDMLTAFFSEQGIAAADIQKAYLLSGGQIGLMVALLNQDAQHPLLDYVDRARTFVGSSAYERLAHLENFAKSREELSLFLQALKRMGSAGFEQTALHGKDATIKRWHHIRQAVLKCETTLRHNPNVKLALTDLSLRI